MVISLFLALTFFPQKFFLVFVLMTFIFLGLMKNFNKIMMVLLSMELLSIIFIYVLISFIPMNLSFPLLFSFFSLAVSEASVGLSLLLNFFRMWEKSVLTLKQNL